MDEALEAKVLALESLVRHLPEKDREFAKSLVKQFKTRSGLSDKQWYWVDKLIASATGTEVQPQKTEVGDFSKVIGLFKLAQKHLKYPKINLLVGVQPIALSVAGSASKAPGTVNVTDGRPYGQNVWFGRVTPEGTWVQGQNAEAEELKAVEQFLKKFGQDPAGTAKEYGKLTGRCCFCNSKLTDEKSTAAGFGPVCADHYGLKDEWKAAVAVLEQV